MFNFVDASKRNEPLSFDGSVPPRCTVDAKHETIELVDGKKRKKKKKQSSVARYGRRNEKGGVNWKIDANFQVSGTIEIQRYTRGEQISREVTEYRVSSWNFNGAFCTNLVIANLETFVRTRERSREERERAGSVRVACARFHERVFREM